MQCATEESPKKPLTQKKKKTKLKSTGSTARETIYDRQEAEYGDEDREKGKTPHAGHAPLRQTGSRPVGARVEVNPIRT